MIWPYYFIYLILFFFSFLEVYTAGRIINSKKWLFLLILLLILFTGLRWDVGNDFISYVTAYKQLHTLTYHQYFEPTFVLLMKISPNVEFLFFIIALASLLLVYKYLFLQTKYPICSFFLYFSIYFIIFNIHILRQGLAISVVVMGLYYFEKRKILGLSLLALAITIHYSAAIILPILLLSKVAEKSRLSISAMVLITFGLLLVIVQFHLISNFVESLNLRYAKVYFDAHRDVGVYLSLGAFMYVLFALYIGLYYPFYLKRGMKQHVYFYWSSLLVYILCLSHSILTRLPYYGLIYFCILVPELFEIYQDKLAKLILFLLIALVSFLYLYKNINAGVAHLDYHTIFFK
jgi:hypothetical protein